MRRLTVLKSAASLLQGAFLSTSAFAEQLEKLQSQLGSVSPDRRAELLRHGRHLFESEKLDDAENALNSQNIGRICQSASQLRISPIKSVSFGQTIDYCLSEKAENTLELDTVARVIHSCLVLRYPLLHEVLCCYTWPIIHQASTLGGVSIAVIINAYGRAGYHHSRLYPALCKEAAVKMKDSRVYLPHIANVAHALARVGYSDPALLLVLRDQAVKQSESASPLIAVTLLDAFASLGYMDEQVFQIYEKRIVSCMNEIQGPLLASFFSCLVLANRADKAVVDSIGERVVAIIDTLDSSSIAKFCKAYADSGIVSEEVLGSLAEHSCKVASNFRADEIHQVLHCLSSFDLFDGELFPLLAGRLAILFKQSGQGEIVRPTDAAGTLASFAAVQENSDELAYVCTNICALQNILPADAYINVLWACATLNIRNEAQTKLLNRVREQPTLLDFPAEDSGKSKRSARLNSILTDRKNKVLNMYALS